VSVKRVDLKTGRIVQIHLPAGLWGAGGMEAMHDDVGMLKKCSKCCPKSWRMRRLYGMLRHAAGAGVCGILCA
jgi:hypothetical protein